MNTSDIENVTRHILAESKLELENPDFSNLVMHKIRRVNRKKTILHHTGLFFSMLFVIDALIIAGLKILKINVTDMCSNVNAFIHEFSFSIPGRSSLLFQFFMAYIFVLAGIVWGLNRLLASRYKLRN